MRPFVVLLGLLAASLLVCAFLLRSNFNLREQIASAEAELAIVNLARKADSAALATSHDGRQQAAETAKERRDALHEIEKEASTLSDAELLCRLRGVCAGGETGSPAAPGRTDAGLSGTDGTAKHDGGE